MIHQKMEVRYISQSTASGKKHKNPENFQFVLPYMANIGNAGAGLEETNVNLELYIPGTIF